MAASHSNTLVEQSQILAAGGTYVPAYSSPDGKTTTTKELYRTQNRFARMFLRNIFCVKRLIRI